MSQKKSRELKAPAPPPSTTKGPKYTVHIIESPSPDDCLKGREERTSLRHVLEQAGIDCRAYLAVNVQTFGKALASVTTETPKGNVPIVHLSMHGNKKGLVLTSGESFSWVGLGSGLQIINALVEKNALLLCLSSCEGFAGAEMATKTDGAKSLAPFHTIVGPQKSVAWDDARVAFVTFYHLVIAKHLDPTDAAKTMNVAAGLPSSDRDAVFRSVTAHSLQRFQEIAERVANKLLEMQRQGAFSTK